VNVPPVFCLTVLDFTKATSPFSTRHLQSARQGERREEVREQSPRKCQHLRTEGGGKKPRMEQLEKKDNPPPKMVF